MKKQNKFQAYGSEKTFRLEKDGDRASDQTFEQYAQTQDHKSPKKPGERFKELTEFLKKKKKI